MRILILGGYGVFGGRLAHLLRDVPTLTLLVCGRSLAKAERYCANYQGSTKVIPVASDRREIIPCLARWQPDLVVDASGPFQDYGAGRYQVIEACIEAGVDYLDFADGADFVSGVSAYDGRARRAGVFVLSGVSSFPVLTAAVLREMAKTMEITNVLGGIAPSPYAGIGLNVMRAVVGYAGAPVKLTRGGRAGQGIGLAESMRYTVAVPGRLPLRNLRFSLVDVPDLQVLPTEHPTISDIWMGAGPVPEVLHRVLNLLAMARYRLRLPSLVRFSRLFYAVLNLMKFGEHRGGMFVHATGRRDGQSVEQSWHLLAEGDDGPYIPSMAIEAIVRKTLGGRRPAAGARSAANALELADYEALFASRTIYCGFRDDRRARAIYHRILGAAFNKLPPSLMQLHGSSEQRVWSGIARVERGNGILAWLISSIIGFPRNGSDVPVTVGFTPDADGEVWTRTFGDRTFRSHQSCGDGRNHHLLVERFGILSIALALVLDEGRMCLVPRRWSILNIPLPSMLLPNGTSFEFETDGRFSFSVDISLPLLGRIVAYQGELRQE